MKIISTIIHDKITLIENSHNWSIGYTNKSLASIERNINGWSYEGYCFDIESNFKCEIMYNTQNESFINSSRLFK